MFLKVILIFFLDSILTNWIKNSEPSNDFFKNQSYFSFKNYLFIYLVAVGLSCSTWVLSVQSTDSVVVEHGLPACGLWSRGLNSCSKVRGISVAPSGIMSHALQGRFFITRLPGKSAESFHHIKKKNKTFQEIWIPTTVWELWCLKLDNLSLV